jgi:hypothetical protein
MARNQDPACKKAVNWVTRNIRRMVRKRALERWETKLTNCEVASQAIWSIAKSLSKKGGPKAPSEIHGLLGPIFYPVDKVNGCCILGYRVSLRNNMALWHNI